jgi:CheY-like chemotaxis protein
MDGKILVVHRNELILDVIQEMLQDVGYAVSLTSDPQRALSKAMAHSYEVIIIDRHLDGEFDGVRLVELLRKYGVQSPVIGTAPNADWAEQSIDLVDRLLPAPFDYSELIKAVADLLEDEPHPMIDGLRSDTNTQEEDHLKLDLSDLLPSPPAKPDAAPQASSTETHKPESLPMPIATSRQIKQWQPPHIEKYDGPTRVIFSENAEDTRAQYEGWLSEAGVEVTACKSGDEIVEATMLANFDLILIDLWTSGMDGFATLETLRMSGVTTPVIITAGYITKEMVSELLPHKIKKIVLKPTTRDVLMKSINETVPV